MDTVPEMTQYETIPQPIRAFRFDGTEQSALACVKWIHSNCSEGVDVCIDYRRDRKSSITEISLKIDMDIRYFRLVADQWLIQEGSSFPFHLSDQHFVTKYREAQ